MKEALSSSDTSVLTTATRLTSQKTPVFVRKLFSILPELVTQAERDNRCFSEFDTVLPTEQVAIEGTVALLRE
jgi:hypothetical protein